MNSNHVDRPTTITASEFMAGGYAGKIARGECVVKSSMYDYFPVYNVEFVKRGQWDIAITDSKSTYASFSSSEFTVEWLPLPATDRAAAAPLPESIENYIHKAGYWQHLIRIDDDPNIKSVYWVELSPFTAIETYEAIKLLLTQKGLVIRTENVERRLFDVYKPSSAPLLPQTTATARYGTPEFAALESDYYEAEIARLQAENARLRNALKPFAEVEEETRESRYSVNELTGVTVLYGWLKQASAALAGHNSEPDHR